LLDSSGQSSQVIWKNTASEQPCGRLFVFTFSSKRIKNISFGVPKENTDE
jgi:hypothetical protein